jgi:hypothetical protein
VPARAVTVFSVSLVVIGLALVVRTALLGGGIGLLLGALFVAAGAGRLYLLKRRPRR